MPLKVVSLLAAALLTWSADAHAGEAEKVTVSHSGLLDTALMVIVRQTPRQQ